MAAQTVYSNSPPGGGNPFFAGLEELFSSPKAFAQDAASVATAGAVPQSVYVPTGPGGGSSLLAGTEELVQAPEQFTSDLASNVGDLGKSLGLPTSGTFSLWLVLGVVGILGVAYISHKAL